MNPKPVPSAPKTTVTLEDIFRGCPVREEALGKAPKKVTLDGAGTAGAPKEEPNSCTVGPLDASNPQR